MSETILAFMERQRRRYDRFTREAEAAGHEVYRRAIRAGQELKLAQPSDVIRHGAKVLQDAEKRVTGAVSSATRPVGRQAGDTINRIGKIPVLRSAAVGAAGSAGTLAGIVRGGVRAAEGFAEGGAFISRLANPLDRYVSQPGQSAVDQLARAGLSAAEYVGKAVTDPSIIIGEVKEKVQQARVDLDPNATPTAPTFAGELQRNFNIGQNQGELIFDTGVLVVGGPAAKAVKGFKRASNVGKVEKYVAQGLDPRSAAHLAKPYPKTNRGSHFIPRRTRLPDILGGGPIPHKYMDGPFNKLVPPGISRGDFYELHYAVDPKFYGTSVLGKRWSGRDLGLRRHGPLGRLWHGSPAPLKARVGGLGAAAGGVAYDLEEGENGW